MSTNEFSDITAAAFGDMYDMSDGARPSGKEGQHDGMPSGDTWYTTWGRDGNVYLIHDDGSGFEGDAELLFARSRICRLDGDPNASTDSFRGVNLNPGLLGKSFPHHELTPDNRLGYSSSIYDLDGTLYAVRHHWSPEKELWPPIDSSIIKSTDGGRNWVDHLGRVNADLPGKGEAMFPSLPWTWLMFVHYGQGGTAPNVDQADKYIYLTASGYVARILRSKLPDLNKDDFEYYKGDGLDGMLDSSWSRVPADGRPAAFHRQADTDTSGRREGRTASTAVYNAALGRYVATSASHYFAPGEGFHDTGKSRFIIYTSKHPWGPWREVLSYAIWGRAGWNAILCNRYSTADGLKMWYSFCGEYLGDLWNYGFQYTPVYLSTGAVDTYAAADAKLVGTHLESTCPLFAGKPYVTGFAKGGDKATFHVKNVNGTGWHIARIRYTSPAGNGKTLSVYVNGRKARRLKLSLNRNDYQPLENWAQRGDIYYLQDGDNTIELRQDEGEDAGGVMIDSIAVSRELTHQEGKNVAPDASASASSGDASAAAKGCFDGIREWRAKGTAGEWVRFDWKTAITIDRIILFDLVSMKDQVTAGTLTFSDGSSMKVGKLQNDGQAGTVVTFPPKKITWVKFTIDAVRPGTEHAGLGEIEVRSAP